jgi:hypothetical protein
MEVGGDISKHGMREHTEGEEHEFRTELLPKSKPTEIDDVGT